MSQTKLWRSVPALMWAMTYSAINHFLLQRSLFIHYKYIINRWHQRLASLKKNISDSTAVQRAIMSTTFPTRTVCIFHIPLPIGKWIRQSKHTWLLSGLLCANVFQVLGNKSTSGLVTVGDTDRCTYFIHVLGEIAQQLINSNNCS